LKNFGLYFCYIFLVLNNFLNGAECKKSSNLKIGLINDEYINYEPYLYYMLGEYSLNNSVEFQIEFLKNNPEEFDIIFGEYYKLRMLTKKNINLPIKIENFYEKNGVKISNNLLPLDLDTFIILKKNDLIQELNLQDLANYYDPIKYTLGTDFNKKKILQLLIYSLESDNLDFQDIFLESYLTQYNKLYSNLNKNIIKSNYQEIFDSYLINENLFTLFSDGILLYKNLQYSSFQLFPKSKYIWSDINGTFIENKNLNPISSYGFSAYLNSDNTDLMCYLFNADVRIKSFQDFNIQISPFSEKEVESIKNKLSEKYLNILKKKNSNIVNFKFTYDDSENKIIETSIGNLEELLLKYPNKNYLD